MLRDEAPVIEHGQRWPRGTQERVSPLRRLRPARGTREERAGEPAGLRAAARRASPDPVMQGALSGPSARAAPWKKKRRVLRHEGRRPDHVLQYRLA